VTASSAAFGVHTRTHHCRKIDFVAFFICKLMP